MSTRGAHFAVALASAAILVPAAGCTGSTDKAGGATVSHPWVLHVVNTLGSGEVQPFVDKVVELSDGRLKPVVDDEWERGSTTSEVDAIRAVQAGKTELAVVPARAWHSVGVNDFDALIAPLEVDSMAVQHKVLASAVSTQMLAGVDRLGLQGIGVLPGPMRLPAGITRSLLAPLDYAGARIGFSPSAVADRSLRALGATPVQSAFQGASIDTDDGIEQQAISVANNDYDGIVRTITTNVNLWPRPLVIVANAKAFATMSVDQRDWLRSAARDALDATTKVQMNQADLAPLCRRGKTELVTASATQLAQLRTAVAPVNHWLRRDTATARYLAEIDALKAGVTPYPHETASCAGIPAANASTAAVTPLDGVYQMTVTPAQLRAAGSIESSPAPENYGTFRWVLDRGRWDETQHSDRSSTWTHGHFTVHGDLITTYVDAAGGIAPGGAVGHAGDSATFRWSLYRDQLTLGPKDNSLKPGDYPFEHTVNPWRRVGNA